MAWFRKFLKRSPDDAGGGGGDGGGSTPPAGDPPAGDPPATPPAGGAGDPPPGGTPPAGTPPAGDGKGAEGYWPADWRDTVSKGDAKTLQRMSRYQSPQALADALIAAQNRISAGELKPVLGKNATPEQVKEYREALGIPETPDKYDLGKDIKIEGMDPTLLGEVFKAAHESNQTPEQLKSTMKAWTAISNQVAERRAEADIKVQKDSEDALRAEWGGEFRRNINLVHGMLDGSGSQTLKDQLMGGRLADGTPIGSSPEMLKMLVGLALIQNPTGIVVPGGNGAQGEGIKQELEKLQKIPTAKKTTAESDRQRGLIDAAINASLMDKNGNWKK